MIISVTNFSVIFFFRKMKKTFTEQFVIFLLLLFLFVRINNVLIIAYEICFDIILWLTYQNCIFKLVF